MDKTNKDLRTMKDIFGDIPEWFVKAVKVNGVTFNPHNNVVELPLSALIPPPYDLSALKPQLIRSQVSAFLGRTDISEFQGALLHPFSVSETKKIVFSKGNLQFSRRGSHDTMDERNVKGTWRFAEHQYTTVGGETTGVAPAGKYNPKGFNGTVYDEVNGTLVKSDNLKAYTDPNYEGWFDCFAYGTSGWNGGKPIYKPGDYYYATDASLSDEYYVRFMTDGTRKADWGVYNAISNGGACPDLWRSIQHKEFKYLLLERDNHFNLSGYGRIVLDEPTPDGVQYVYGVIILPDDWTGAPSGCTFDASNKTEVIQSGANKKYSWTMFDEVTQYTGTDADYIGTNEYTESQWALMESYGAVFIPYGGLVRVSYNYSDREDGLTYLNGVASRIYASHWLAGTSGTDNPNMGSFFSPGPADCYVTLRYKDYAMSVRLVMDVDDLNNPVVDTLSLKGENSNALIKTDGTDLLVSFDSGSTWNTVTTTPVV